MRQTVPEPTVCLKTVLTVCYSWPESGLDGRKGASGGQGATVSFGCRGDKAQAPPAMLVTG